MKTDGDKKKSGNGESVGRGCVRRLLKCDDIREVLFDYLSRELSDSQAVLVREHLHKCPACRAEAAEIEQTLALLHKEDERPLSIRLSDDRRKRIRLAVFHPVLNWMYEHHRLVSLLLALLVLTGALYGLRNFAIFRHPDLGHTVRVWIRPFTGGKSPGTDAAPEKKHEGVKQTDQSPR